MFEFSADARFEFVHPADAGTAFARAVACEEAVGKILYVGGGEKCQMTHREFSNELMRAIGIGAIPAEAFVRGRGPRFLGDWVDTEESQRLLQYQRRGLGELKADMRKDLGVVAPLVRLLRPVATWFLLRGSPYLAENRRAGSHVSLPGEPLVADLDQVAEPDPPPLRHGLDAPDVLRRLLARPLGRPEERVRVDALARVVGEPHLLELAADLEERERRPAVPHRQERHGERALEDQRDETHEESALQPAVHPGVRRRRAERQAVVRVLSTLVSSDLPQSAKISRLTVCR